MGTLRRIGKPVHLNECARGIRAQPVQDAHSLQDGQLHLQLPLTLHVLGSGGIPVELLQPGCLNKKLNLHYDRREPA